MICLKKKAFFLIKFESLKSGAVARRCSVKKVFLKISQNSQENTCAIVTESHPEACNFIKGESLAEVFYCGLA